MTELAIFASTFAAVFFLGVQSLNVNGGHYLAAFLTSFGISLSHLVLYKTVPDADLLQQCAYLLGGPFGIVCAMWTHARIKRRAPPLARTHSAKLDAVLDAYHRGAKAALQHRQSANTNCGADGP